MDSFMKTRIFGRALGISLACLTLLLSFSSPAEAIVYLDITSANFRKVKMAVPFFVDKKNPAVINDGGRKMADLLGRALTFHGFVDIIPAAAYGGTQTWDWPAL